MNPLTATLEEILRADPLELFGVLSFAGVSSLQQIYDGQGRLPESTIHAVDRAARKFSLRLHPDKNSGSEETRNAFEHVRRAVEFLKNSAELFSYAQKQIGTTNQELKRVDGVSRALAAGAKLEQRMAQERELRRMEQARAAAELQANLHRMASSTANMFDAAPSSSNSSSKEAANATAAMILARERRKQMTEWERLEEEMLQDWDVDEETLKKKSTDMQTTMQWLEEKSRNNNNNNNSGTNSSSLQQSSNSAASVSGTDSAADAAARRAANIAAIMAQLDGGGFPSVLQQQTQSASTTAPQRRDRQM